MFRFGILLLVGLLCAPVDAVARFVLLDAIFDDKTLWDPLDRRGARYDEPILGPYDFGYEYVDTDGGTDHSVHLMDLVLDGAHRLTWSFKNQVEVSDGRLRVSFELLGDGDAYDVIIDGPDHRELPYFRLILADNGAILSLDGNSPTPVVRGAWTSITTIAVEVDFDLDFGTYDLAIDGVTVVSSESFGSLDYGISQIHIGHMDDGDLNGALEIDNLFVEWRPGTATPLLLADFDAEPVGAPIGTGGAALGQPVRVHACVPTVETGGFPSPSLRVADESTTIAGSARFEFLNEREVAAGDVSISLFFRVNTLESYTILLREQGSAADEFLSLTMSPNGILYLGDGAEIAHYHSMPYDAQVSIRLEAAFDMDNGRYTLWLDGVRVAHRRHHGQTGAGLGSLSVGTGYDTNLDGRIRVDGIEIHELPEGVSAVAENGAELPAGRLLARLPNPLHRSGTLPLEVAEPGRLRLDIVDASGRLLRTLLDDAVDAGTVAPAWDGRDARGRRLAAGLYFVRARFDGVGGTSTAARKIALVR